MYEYMQLMHRLCCDQGVTKVLKKIRRIEALKLKERKLTLPKTYQEAWQYSEPFGRLSYGRFSLPGINYSVFAPRGTTPIHVELIERVQFLSSRLSSLVPRPG